MLSALLCAVLGAVLLIWPEATIDLVCKILAVGLIIMGAVQITSYFTNKSIHPFAGALGLLLVLVGVWVFIRPDSIVSIVPIVIGVILCVHGLQDFKPDPGDRLYRERVWHGEAGAALYRNCPDL